MADAWSKAESIGRPKLTGWRGFIGAGQKFGEALEDGLDKSRALEQAAEQGDYRREERIRGKRMRDIELPALKGLKRASQR